jgi:DNA-binding NarL/FixJ family response regulator
MTIKLALVEDETLIRESLLGLFATNPQFVVVRSASTVEAFLETPLREIPDVMLLDIGLQGGMSGLNGIRAIKEVLPRVEIIMLTTFEEPDYIFKALCAGASGYLTKRSSFPKIVEAVEAVHHGGSFMSPSIARKIVDYFAPKQSETEALTPRQMQIVEGILEGLSYKMIADKLLIGTETVRDHIKTIYRKLEINSKTELIRKKMKGEI